MSGVTIKKTRFISTETIETDERTHVVRADLQSLIASHHEPNLLGLLVL